MVEIKSSIQNSIENFKGANLTDASLNLFKILGYNTDRQSPFSQKTYHFFKDSFLDSGNIFNEQKAFVSDWQYIDLLFQLSKDEINITHSLFDTKQVDRTIIETYLFFVIELFKPEYTRTTLSQITREVNKVFPMPVMILFKYGTSLTFSIINHRLHKHDEQKDVLEKVTLIKDINIEKPHRAHIEILFDLSFYELLRVHKFSNFVELHNAWQKTLDTKELNKRFYQELSNWYFWAMKEVYYPGAPFQASFGVDALNDPEIREHNAKNLIRLLTRILFVWFIKEKNLIPEELFDENFIKDKLLTNFGPRKKGTFDHKTQGSKYYRAILQNLFFATLNQTVGKREFRKDGQHMNVTNLMRYESYFQNPKAFVKLVEDKVPFMNGGLFECLDKPDPEKRARQGGDVIIYEDGFSDRPDNTLFVPDYIFFGTQEHVDLSEEYGKPGRNAQVKGLIDILKSYKFTITENTPIEEDIALDPELLGRVFENLLASYNPETKTTARKQTGSFYTPREIVNYMVDESLVAYLRQKLTNGEEKETEIRNLINYSDNPNHFSSEETELLIDAIDNCKILDPACGSGAFPMGILHKMTLILHKLDPKNHLWKERQIVKANLIDDNIIRDQLIEDIEAAFSHNELDYGRKLYLIENCIYGVDIQPIATQISKLRFFISLIVDQKVDFNRDNFGVRPLPNLETKFVAADTLIGIEKPEAQTGLFDNKEIKALETKLSDVRHRLFSAKTPMTKRKLREDDRVIREKMSDLLVENGWANESAKQLAGWDPYDQNLSSPFFDIEWMFGFKSGFDVVIANPPYLEISAIDWDSRRLYETLFDTATGRFDLYALFIEKGMQLKKTNGTLIYIVPGKFLNNKQFATARRIICDNHSVTIVKIDDKVFEAQVDSAIIQSYLGPKTSNKKYKSFKMSSQELEFVSETSLDTILIEKEAIFKIDINDKLDVLIAEIEKDAFRVNQIGEVKDGIVAGEIKDILFLDKKLDKDSKELYFGKHLTKYHLDETSVWVNYKPGEMMKVEIKRKGEKRPGLWMRDERIFNREKILSRFVAKEIIATYDNENRYYEHTLHSTHIFDERFKTKYVLGVFNSSIIKFYYQKTNSHGGDIFPQVRIASVENLPIKSASIKTQETVEQIVNLTLFLKNYMEHKYQMISFFFERLLDAVMYEVYLPKEVSAADCEILKYLTCLPELQDNWDNEKKLQSIEKVYKELSDTKHPVSVAMFKMDTVEEIRIIEGKQ